MSEEATGVKWKDWGYNRDAIDYTGDGFAVQVRGHNWWVRYGGKLVIDAYALDHATAKHDAERWILEREGRLPAPATDGGWIACGERMPEAWEPVEVISVMRRGSGEWFEVALPTHWRPRTVDPHADAACLLSDDFMVMDRDRAIKAARHVAGCEACQAKLEAKGGA